MKEDENFPIDPSRRKAFRPIVWFNSGYRGTKWAALIVFIFLILSVMGALWLLLEFKLANN